MRFEHLGASPRIHPTAVVAATAVISGTERPVPLEFSYAVTPLHETIEKLLEQDRAPVYVVHFTQAAALERAQSLMAVKITSREERDAIAKR